MRIFKRFALAASYVTSIPFTGLLPAQVSTNPVDAESPDRGQELLQGLTKYLPVVGLMLGIFLAGTALILVYLGAKSLLLSLIITLVWFALTGGLHMDGLMDTADGIASHRSRERMLEIMSDPRVGNFGSLVGTAALLTKFATLASMPLHPVPNILLAVLITPAWARWCEAFAIGRFNYAKPEGKGKIWHDTTKFPSDILIAVAVPLLSTCIACCFGYWIALVVAGFSVASGLTAAYWFNGKLTGQTGDTYGAVVEISEAGSLIGCALVLQCSLPM